MPFAFILKEMGRYIFIHKIKYDLKNVSSHSDLIVNNCVIHIDSDIKISVILKLRWFNIFYAKNNKTAKTFKIFYFT